VARRATEIDSAPLTSFTESLMLLHHHR